MTREEAKQLLPVIQAFAEGKRIEYGNDDDWSETDTPTWSTDFVYRIKSEPKYRPFKNKDECWNEMLKHEPFGYIKRKGVNMITQVNRLSTLKKGEVSIDIAHCLPHSNTVDYLFEHYTFTDGTPFGIKEE